MMFIILIFKITIAFILTMLILLPPFYTYVIIRDHVRLFLYRRGYRVFTRDELVVLGFIPKVENGVVETTAIKKNTFEDKGTFEASYTDVSESNKISTKTKKKKEIKEKVNNFENPLDRFKNFKI
jgi:hypothetical protein